MTNRKNGRPQRAKPSGFSLTAGDAAIVKARLSRGDRQSDIAADYRVNAGRVSEINTGKKFADVPIAQLDADN